MTAGLVFDFLSNCDNNISAMEKFKKEIIEAVNRKGFITADYFAQAAGISIDWVYRLARSKKINAVKLDWGHVLFIEKKSLQSYQAKRKKQSLDT